MNNLAATRLTAIPAFFELTLPDDNRRFVALNELLRNGELLQCYRDRLEYQATVLACMAQEKRALAEAVGRMARWSSR